MHNIYIKSVFLLSWLECDRPSITKSGIYGFLLGTQRTFCFKPRGSPGSSPLRSDGSRDDQAGEAGPAEHSSAEAKSLKTRGQRTVRLPPQWATTKAARQEGQRQK